MTGFKDIEVITYDGYRANERPVGVVFSGERFDVKEIEESWIATGVDLGAEVTRGFLVRCTDGLRFRLTYTEKTGWQGVLLPGPHLVRER